MLHAAKWVTVSNVLNQFLVGAVTFILAALLNPSQFGTVAMAYLYITFLQQLTGFGFNSALIQRLDIEKRHLDSVFWLNVASGLFFALVAVVLSGWWSRVNRMPDLSPMIIALSAIMPIEGFSVVQVALLQRRMEFKRLAVRDNLATAVGGAIGVAAALAGLGGWALVLQHIGSETTSVLTLWRVSDWRPGLEFKWSAVRELTNYSLKTLAGRIGTFAQNSTDSLLIGFMLGPAAVGLYRLANRLVEMILMFVARAILTVSLPHYAKFQSDLPELNRNFLFGSHLSCLVTFPALGFLAGASRTVLAAIGPQWSEAVDLLQILTLVGMAKTVILLVTPLLQAVSRPGILSLNFWTLAAANALAVWLAARLFAGAAQESLIACVGAFRVFAFLGIFTPLLLWHAKKATGLSLSALAETIRPALVTALAVGGSQWMLEQAGFRGLFPNRFLALAASAAIGGAVWLAFISLLDGVARDYIRSAGRWGRNLFLRTSVS
jgi:PST family polysaccharide transporter